MCLLDCYHTILLFLAVNHEVSGYQMLMPCFAEIPLDDGNECMCLLRAMLLETAEQYIEQVTNFYDEQSEDGLYPFKFGNTSAARRRSRSHSALASVLKFQNTHP